MSTVTIPNLPAAGVLTGTEVLPIVQSGTTSKTTVQDIADLSSQYKVYTALLTQNGGDNVMYLTRGEELTIGVTYTIYSEGSSGWDLTNVGAPNNNVGTTFVATGTTPNSYGSGGDPEYVSYNTGAPVVTVLENTIGNIWFTYSNPGVYLIESNELFTQNKTYLPQPNIDISLVANIERFLFIGWNNENALTLNNTDIGFLSTNDIGRGYLEIRVYN